MEKLLQTKLPPELIREVQSFLIPSEQRVRKVYSRVLMSIMSRSFQKLVLAPLIIDDEGHREEDALEKTEIYRQYDAINHNFRCLYCPNPCNKPKGFGEKKKYGM